MPTATCPMPDQESSQERSAWSARSCERSEKGVESECCAAELAALMVFVVPWTTTIHLVRESDAS
jgi:hypothetical protein